MFQFKIGRFMILDGQTLINLEILENTVDGGKQGTLLGLLDHCVTGFGKRLLKQWICHPLRNIEDIADRQSAIKDLVGISPTHQSNSNASNLLGNSHFVIVAVISLPYS